MGALSIPGSLESFLNTSARVDRDLATGSRAEDFAAAVYYSRIFSGRIHRRKPLTDIKLKETLQSK